jgi:hypothetical protein
MAMGMGEDGRVAVEQGEQDGAEMILASGPTAEAVLPADCPARSWGLSPSGPDAPPARIRSGAVPTLLVVEGFRFFFFSREGTEPRHVHVEKGRRSRETLALSRGAGLC